MKFNSHSANIGLDSFQKAVGSIEVTPYSKEINFEADFPIDNSE